jgi:ABC-type multidrug transport system ATPase subunit
MHHYRELQDSNMRSSVEREVDRFTKLENVESSRLRLTKRDKLSLTIRILARVRKIKKEIGEFGYTPDLTETIRFLLDELICGETQLSAVNYLNAGGEYEGAVQMANHRILSAATLLVRSLGVGLTGFSLGNVLTYGHMAAFGQSSVVVSNIIDSHQRNQSGSAWNNILHKQLISFLAFVNLEELLKEGFSNEEIRQIEQLKKVAYDSELDSPTLASLETILLPASISISLLAQQKYDIGILTLMLGLTAFPLGEWAHKQSDKFRSRQFRAGRSAGKKGIKYLKDVYSDHIRMTNKLNTVSQTDSILSVALMLLTYLKGADIFNLLSSLYGIRYGLQGLNGSLTRQRKRETARLGTALAKKLIQEFNSKDLILTQKRWLEHISNTSGWATSLSGREASCKNGLVVESFRANIPNRQEVDKFCEVSFVAESGKTVIIKGESGSGKSTLIGGLQHVVEHEGDVYFAKDSVAVNAHKLSGPEEVGKKIGYFNSEKIPLDSTLIDLVNEYFLHFYPVWGQERWINNKGRSIQFSKGDMEVYQTFLFVEDNLLAKEIEVSEKALVDGGEKPIFSKELCERLSKFRSARKTWFDDVMNQQGGNLAYSDINYGRVFKSLSAGQKQRFTLLLAELSIKTNSDLSAVFLDEPLDKLDLSVNFPLQLQKIKNLQDEGAVPIVIIANQHLEILQQELDTTLVTLEKNGENG